MKIATLGPRGTFSNEAVVKYNNDAEISFSNTIYDVFESVEKDETKVGVVPVENSVSGSVWLTIDALSEFDLNILGEVLIPINHNLAGKSVKAEDVKKLYCHHQAYVQCEKFIRRRIKNAKVVYTSSNGESAELLAADGKNDSAAIVPRIAASINKLRIIMKNVQDNKNNTTKFIVIGKDDSRKSGKDRTTVLIYPHQDKAGLLYSILGILAEHKINLSKLESIPSKGKIGDYFFLVELLGHKDDKRVTEAIEKLEDEYVIKVKGSYRREY
jgi:prephenate dehydratase